MIAALDTAPTPRRFAFPAVAYALFMSNAGGNLLSPLYALYQQRWGFDAYALTLVYAIYALVLIPGLPLFGTLSRYASPRAFLLGATLCVALGSVLALAAADLAWLCAARVAQGIGIALMSGVGAKTLVQLVAPSEHDRASLAATATLAGGGAFGVLMAGVLAQYFVAPLKLPYVVHLGLLLPAALALCVIDLPAQPLPTAGSSRTRPAARVPGSRAVVAVACCAGFTAFAVLGLFLSLAPSLVSAALHTHAPMVGAAVAAAMLISSALAQMLGRLLGRTALMLLGLFLLPGGLLAFDQLIADAALVPIVLSIVVGGVGHGFIFLVGLEMIDRVSTATNRAALAAIYFAASYAGASLPVIALGFATRSMGAASAVAGYAALVSVVCVGLVAAFGMVRHRVPEQSAD